MLDSRRSGDAIAASAVDLARVWRSAHAATRRARFPGLLDGVIEPFFRLAGEALAQGRDPARVWEGTEGVVRVDARDVRSTRAELDAEWGVAEQVLKAACRALTAGDPVEEWLSRAIAIARGGRRSIAGGKGPRGILIVRAFTPGATRRERAP